MSGLETDWETVDTCLWLILFSSVLLQSPHPHPISLMSPMIISHLGLNLSVCSFRVFNNSKNFVTIRIHWIRFCSNLIGCHIRQWWWHPGFTLLLASWMIWQDLAKFLLHLGNQGSHGKILPRCIIVPRSNLTKIENCLRFQKFDEEFWNQSQSYGNGSLRNFSA